MQALARYANEVEKIDMILWTGDSVSHDIHRISQDQTYETLVQLTTLLR